MNQRQQDILIAVAGAAVEVGLSIVVAGSDWPMISKLLLVALLPAALMIYFSLRARIGAYRMTRRSVEKPPRRLEDLYKAKGMITPGWFVSFTSGPYPTRDDPRGEYATAIAEVVHVEGDEVHLSWRDRAKLPLQVPVQLLDANEIVRFRDGRRVRTQNSGLRIPSPGSIVTSLGWAAHRNSPWQVAFVRFSDLEAEHQRAMEADGVLSTYDIDGLKG